MSDVVSRIERWGRLLARFRELEVVARGDRWLCVRLGGEKVTVAPVGEHGVEIIVAVCREREIDARAALLVSRSLALGALVLADRQHCLRQVLPLDLVEPEHVVRLAGALVMLVRDLRAWTAARARDEARPFAGYAA